MNTNQTEELMTYLVTPEQYGQRLDQVAAQAFGEYSRARLQAWIKSGHLLVNGELRKPKDKLCGGEQLSLQAEAELEDRWLAQAIPLDVVFSDEQLIIVNKPAGLVVHPGAGVPDGTMLNGLLHHFPELAAIPRAGIVHRLDKETSGLMVVARSLMAHHALTKQLQDRSLGREYQAVVMGNLTGGGTVDAPMARHPVNRLKMAVVKDSSRAKEAITHYRLLHRYPRYTHILCQLETGRTHQIRVHMAHIHHPLVGDPVYLGRQRWLSGTSSQLQEFLANFKRQALHAGKLTLVHPHTGATLSWEAALPDDFSALLNALSLEKQESERND